jgi:hypothetical protein
MRKSMLLLVIAACASARADDGVLYFHGPPKLLKGGSHIRMVQEYVLAKIGETKADVYCRFVFHNMGGPSVVRVGFPDGVENHEEDGNLKPAFKQFHSSVDGHAVATKMVKTPADESYGFFYEKVIRFGKGQTRVVEDWYKTPLDDGATSSPYYYVRGFTYVMASGGSWDGKIGSATVKIQLLSKKLQHPHPVPIEQIGNAIDYQGWASIPKHFVFYSGFAKPTHAGNTLVFYRRRFKPTVVADIKLAFGARIVRG